MSIPAARGLLLLGLALMLPLPILFLADGWVPAGRLLMLGGITLAVMVFESARGVAPVIAAVLLGQAALYLLLLWGSVRLLARAGARLSPRALTASTLAAVALLAVVALGSNLYRTPFAADAARGNLVHVYR